MAESPPTIYDVARESGVSIATVSRVLNGYDHTRDATRDRVMAAVDALGFVPNAAARGLSRGRKRILGLVFAQTPADDNLLAVEETSLLFTDSVIRGAEARAASSGYSLLLSSAGGVHREGSSLRQLTGNVDGLILLDRVIPEHRVASLSHRVPVVLLAGSGRSRSAVTVRADNEGGVAALAEHLVKVHHVRHAGFIGGFADSPDSIAREQCFAATLSSLGASCHPTDMLSADWTSSGAAAALRERMQADRVLPEVIACANDQMALGAMYTLAGSGISVPSEIAVVGFDDIPVARYLTPPLTTVRQPSSQLGIAAVDALLAAIAGSRPSSRIVLPTELVVRGSCGCPVAPMAPRMDGAVLVSNGSHR